MIILSLIHNSCWFWGKKVSL